LDFSPSFNKQLTKLSRLYEEILEYLLILHTHMAHKPYDFLKIRSPNE